MTQIRLKKLLSKKQQAAVIVSDLLEAINSPISVQDSEGNILIGPAHNGSPGKYPITCGHDLIGWTIGHARAEPIATLLTYLANKEAEKDTLTDETLERYRELNLLYHLSEKLTASLELIEVAQMALDEAHRLIKATGGWVMLLNDGQAELETIAAFGQGVQSQQKIRLGESIIGGVALNGKAELVNDIQADVRYVEGQLSTSIRSLVCAPLKTKNRIMGVITLGGDADGGVYRAADLKLLNTVASQAAPAIENALLHEKTLREARKREERLQRQIQALRIELDEARQAQHVAEITGTDYFQQLRSKANGLREMLEGEE
jgi:putative methionine-R-sulfoxide reductase with GAF domain